MTDKRIAELAAAFDDLFAQRPPFATKEEIDQFLREEGYNPDEVAERMEAVAREALAAHPPTDDSAGR